ncbi:DnaJ domain-containing protein, partial [Ochromonadaceae sp. CCMP2298]
MSRVDLYRVLNLSKGATLQEIKGAYRTLAKIHHPDLCTTDKKVAEDTFKKLSAAYQTLSNARTKAVYD